MITISPKAFEKTKLNEEDYVLVLSARSIFKLSKGTFFVYIFTFFILTFGLKNDEFEGDLTVSVEEFSKLNTR